MINPSAHRAKRSFHRLGAVMLTTVYMLIVMSPLASLAMHSKTVAHAVTGECVGDCSICGCSPEAVASRTCCCAKKKQQQANMSGIASDTCYAPKTAAVEQNRKCYSKPAPTPPEPAAETDCCAKKTAKQRDDHQRGAQLTHDSSRTETVYKCGCPCGKGKLIALAGYGSNDLLPLAAGERIEPPPVKTLFADLSHRPESRHSEPPDPPPRIPLIS